MAEELGLERVGETVKISGWVQARRDHGGVIFIDLRDHTGLVQLTIHPESAVAFEQAEKVRDEFVLGVSGQVVKRADSMINPNLATGQIEVVVGELNVLNTCSPLPFQIFPADERVNEETRLRHRFLDLRRDKMQSMLIKRHKMIKYIRDWMDEQGFIEITTPTFLRSSGFVNSLLGLFGEFPR